MQTIVHKVVLFTGPMRSSKTTSLLSQFESASAGGIPAGFFRPKFDDRDSTDAIHSRGGYCVAIQPAMVENARELYEQSSSLGFVGIEEAQFFEDDPDFLVVLERLHEQGKEVVIAALDLDWLGQPWPMTREIMALPFVKVIKKRSICVRCKRRNATHTQKLHVDDSPVAITENSQRMETGDAQYRPLCRACWYETTPGARDRLATLPSERLVLPWRGH